MKVFMNYCPYGFSNCYILGSDPEGRDGPRDAVVIDPGTMDAPMLNFIEKYGYVLRGVLVTHDHSNHDHGLRTLKRIYDVDVYAVNPTVKEHKTRIIKDGDMLSLGAITVTVFTVPGHSSDSAVFLVSHLLFTGDALTAGLLGSTISSYGASIQMNALRSKVLSLPGNYIILPGHGPPSSMDAERRFNWGIQRYEENKAKRPKFRIDLTEL
ncbi:MAG: MBL fold metallo-hydrolase [Treponema sp.]|jgi:glyoxylase-like metal-dependent hydrolase (beta-lactamase superfamily II)|nr:MBL fold metallo-hydrolase [Treponema sp.]